jgi:large subunit ribosomal protein L6
MGRFNNRVIEIPASVTLTLDAQAVHLKGAKGSLSFNFVDGVEIKKSEKSVSVDSRIPGDKNMAQYVGLTYRMIIVMIKGVTDGYERILDVEGVGYRWAMKGNQISLQLGYSHPVTYDIPEGISVKTEGSVCTVSGVSKELVGQVAAKIKSYRPVEPYKGKGIRYRGQYVIRKAGKAGGKAA